MIEENILDEKKYPIMVCRYELDGVFYPQMFMGFPPSKYERIFTIQSFLIWGHRFIIFVNDKNSPKIPIDAFLRSSGNLLIRVRSLVELASPDSVFSKLYDEKVNNIYAKME